MVATKCDKLGAEEVASALAALKRGYRLSEAPLPFSAVTAVGRKDLWRLIRTGILGDEETADDDEEGGDGADGEEG